MKSTLHLWPLFLLHVWHFLLSKQLSILNLSHIEIGQVRTYVWNRISEEASKNLDFTLAFESCSLLQHLDLTNRSCRTCHLDLTNRLWRTCHLNLTNRLCRTCHLDLTNSFCRTFLKLPHGSLKHSTSFNSWDQSRSSDCTCLPLDSLLFPLEEAGPPVHDEQCSLLNEPAWKMNVWTASQQLDA